MLLYWAGLQKEVDKEQLNGGAKKLMHSATIAFSAPSAASSNRQMLLINAP
jgi:predicted secreted protein